MSLKQRAVQCSGYIPANQYVPVYSRPHRTNHSQWHEEIAPITPKPTFDDPHNSRTQSIHEAVKQWLESSPNSVIGPLYRSRSPSTASPPSNGESTVQQTPRRADTPAWESNNNDRFHDVGSGALSPRQISIEQSTALHSGSSVSSPRPADRPGSAPWDNANTNRALDIDETAALSPMQESGAKSPECVVLPKEDDDGKSTRANDAVPPSIPEESCGANQDLSHKEEPSVQAEEDTKHPSPARRGGKKRPITDLRSPDQQVSHGISEGSFSDFNSRAASREFDVALALVVKEIEKQSPSDTLSCASANSSVGAPKVLLKPPRGLEKNVPHDREHTLPVALRRVASAREAQNSAVMSPPTLLRATSAREDCNSAVMPLPPSHRASGTTDDTTRVASGTKVNNTAEIVPAGVPEIVEAELGGKENISEDGQKPLLATAIDKNTPGYRATLKKIDESNVEIGSENKSSDGPRLTLKDFMQTEENAAAQQSKSSDSPAVISNGVAAVAGGFGFRQARSSGHTRSSYSSDGSVANAPNNVPQQHIYKTSPLHHKVRKGNRSKKQGAVSPAKAEQRLRRDKSTRSSKSTEREESAAKVASDNGKLEELRLKADAWENAKNITILNRYKREESRIHAWEERKVAKASAALSKLQSDQERKSAMATEKMQYEVAQAHKKAAEMKAHAEAKRAERAAKTAMQAQVIRVIGKAPLSCFCLYPTHRLNTKTA